MSCRDHEPPRNRIRDDRSLVTDGFYPQESTLRSTSAAPYVLPIPCLLRFSPPTPPASPREEARSPRLLPREMDHGWPTRPLRCCSARGIPVARGPPLTPPRAPSPPTERLVRPFPCPCIRCSKVGIHALSGALFLATMGQIMGDVMADALVSRACREAMRPVQGGEGRSCAPSFGFSKV